ncbi:sensor histidine kinase [Selenomonas sp.]|uniref:sensor histidine kinase n=1 Tax=Selenomonas sp. TaxID=2053611 RepID=UPI003FA1B10E
MRSRGRRLWRALSRLRSSRHMRISTWLTLVYAAVLVFVLVFTSIVSSIGIYFSLYHQAEIELTRSQEHVLAAIEHGTEVFNETAPDMRRRYPLAFAVYQDDLLMPGVVLRVTEGANGPVVYESDTHYPSIKLVESHIDKHPPIWANSAMYVSTIGNTHIYYHKVIINQNGHTYVLHFFRTITAERHFLTMLQKVLTVTNLAGIVLALCAGYFISCRILRPIRTMTQAARELEVTDLSRRIAVPPVKDELAELAETFNHMLERIQTGFEQQRRFVSDASHELRTPVTVIRGYSDMLSRWGASDPETLEEGLTAIRSEAEDMQGLIEKLLFLARADQKRLAMHKERLELAPLVDDVVKKMALIATKHEVELLANEAGTVYVDPLLMKHMMRIILENSMKYTPKGGRITVEMHRSAGEMQLSLADNGIGIAKEHQDKVFERFYRVDSSRTKRMDAPGGTGLGLSIARWIADQHGIGIELISELGRGTKFILHIPCVE